MEICFYHMINDDNIDKIYNSTATDISGDLELYYSLAYEMPRKNSIGYCSLQYLKTGRGLLVFLTQNFEIRTGEEEKTQQMHVLVEVVDGKEVMRVDNIMADVPADDRVSGIHHMFKLRSRLLIIYYQGRPNYEKKYIGWSSHSAHLLLRTSDGAKLVDRIVASV
jgi:hypothetical protein